MKKSHVRFFHGKASQKNFSREIFLREGLHRKISHVRFFHGKASQKNFSREFFLREEMLGYFLYLCTKKLSILWLFRRIVVK